MEKQMTLIIDDEFVNGVSLAYVPEAEHLDFWDMLTLATERDIRAANELLWSVLYG